MVSSDNNNGKEEFFLFYWIKTKSLTFFKDNLNLLVLIPALIGGLWQILELSKMSLSYVRFFSVTQLIADGLLILLLCILLLGIVLIIPFYEYWMFPESENKINNVRETEIDKESLSDKYPILGFLSYLILIYGTVYFIANFEVGDIKSFSFFTVVSLVLLLALGTYYMTQRKNSKKNLKIIYVMSAPVGFMILFFFVFFCIYVHNLYLLPVELKNIENLKSKIKVQYSVKEPKIEYLNDKYIFIDISTKKDEKAILILPFEELVKIDFKE